MFELISHKMNRPLVKRFQEIGYDIYRYVPGPSFLAPFRLNNPIDGFQLNLFACKRDRAQQLAARRLLVQDASIELPPPPPSYWFEAIAQLSYVQPLLNQFAQLKDRAQNNPNKQAYLEGISYFFASQQAELSAPEQLAALQSAFDRLQQAVNTSPSFARHCTFARVAAELGQRKLSVQSLGQLVNAMLANKPIQIDEPFLPVSSRYDNVAFNDNFQDWIFVTIVETYERSYTFSSYYSAPKSIGLLNRIVQRPFHSPQVERRLAAAKQRLATLPSPKQSSNQQKEVKKQPISKKTEPKFILIKAWGYGFWSDIDHVLGQLLVAELSGRIPVIHWGDNCLYRDEANSSAFETFFEPISTYTIDDLLGQSYTFYPHKWTEANLETNNLNKWKGSGSRIGCSVFLSRQEDVVVSDFHTYTYHLQKHIPANHPLAGKSLQALYRYLFHKYLKLKPEISHDIEQFWSENLAGHPTLAVHVRGSDKVKEFPELDAINQKYDLAIAAHLESHPNTLIFLLTDEVSVLTDYQQKYGDRLCYTDAFRGNQAKGIHYQAHASHKQLGFEVIKDTYLAAKCDYFIGNGRSVVSATVLHLKEWSDANHILLAENILLNRPTPMPKTVDGLLKSARDLGEQGKTQEAIKHYRKALSLDPNCFAAAVNLGNMLKKDGQYGAALDSYRKGIAILPNNPAAENNLANVLKDQGLTNEAIARFRRAFSLDASFIHAHSNLLLTLNYSSDYAPTDVLAEHQNWVKVYAAPLAKNIRAHSNTLNPDRKLRIGYVSIDFKAHPVAYFLEPILASFDRSAFEVICYSNSNSTDAVTERLQNLASKWRNISALTNQQAADLVREDQIDILVDLGGHTSGNRLLVFAHKPAPVQVTYIGYPNTTGLDTIDYRITDAWADPEGQTEPFHTEELVRLPHGFLCYQPQPETPDIEPASALAVGQITFGSFNNLAKVSPQLIGSWSAILAAVPQAKLILKSTPFSDAATRDSIAKLFEQNGIDRDRLELFGRLPTLNEHLSLYNRVDIALDTFPYNGTTTTCDALWMGTPVIALAGQTHVSRVGVSLLSSIGLQELIAESTEDYVQKAIALANDSERLQTLRGKLRERMQRSPLLNAELFTRSLEDAYQIMWRRWCEACQSKA